MKNPCKKCLVLPMCNVTCKGRKDFENDRNNNEKIKDAILNFLGNACMFIAALAILIGFMVSGAR